MFGEWKGCGIGTNEGETERSKVETLCSENCDVVFSIVLVIRAAFNVWGSW